MKEAEGQNVEQAQDLDRRKRHRKWWILVFVVLVVGVVAMGVLWFRQQRVAEQLKAMADTDRWAYREEVRGPGWYVKLVDEYHLPALRRPVKFRSQAVSYEDLLVVGRANTLRDVALRGPGINDAGLVHLEGLAQLCGFRDLYFLDVSSTGVTDCGLVHLKCLTKLEQLLLYKTRISDSGLAHLSGLTKLRALYLYETKVSDAGLVYLRNLGNLKKLSLDGTEVTDAGLAHLKSLTGLSTLWLRNTDVTSEGVTDLKSAIPDAKVYLK